jgi:dipeptidyl aminopeptidase/acylaminoacyl peptidase
MAAILSPDVFRCALAVSALVNLVELVESIPPRWAPRRANFVRRVGDPATDAEAMRARSPLFRVAELRRPVLIAHGANDPRSPVSEVERFVAQLRAQGTPVEYVLYPKAGHGLSRTEDLHDYLARAELFLSRYLGAC